ncbi:hypothetical protein [Pontibacter mangrovi]|uniref:Zinc-ribbon domain-containing protein n=1 Tax=Pontibacter mangrovi TaxID=2589816 RepID=A0A501W8A6_9BACT|nr:hypothetical protein [Pontibacter mangrovi]TPE45578.1 hypothetical protein FJM65_06020 [Pontibacter mangrovi]
MAASNSKNCPGCGATLPPYADTCPTCGMRQPPSQTSWIKRLSPVEVFLLILGSIMLAIGLVAL